MEDKQPADTMPAVYTDQSGEKARQYWHSSVVVVRNSAGISFATSSTGGKVTPEDVLVKTVIEKNYDAARQHRSNGVRSFSFAMFRQFS